MKRRAILTLSLCLFAMAIAAQAQTEPPKPETQPPQFELEQYQFGLLRKGPKHGSGTKEEGEKVQAGHMANINRMAKLGKLVAAGPMADNGNLRGIFIFKAASLAEAKALSAQDPAIRSGRLVLDLHDWWGPKGIGAAVSEELAKGGDPKFTMARFYLTLFTKGPKWTTAQTPENQQLQTDHLWNIHRLMDAKTVVAAGPLDGKKGLQGLLVVVAASPEEAKAIVETDPRIKAGQLAAEIRPWFVAKEVWP